MHILENEKGIKNLSFHLKKLEKEEQIKSQVSRDRYIRNIETEIKEIENWNQYRKARKPKAGSLKQ